MHLFEHETMETFKKSRLVLPCHICVEQNSDMDGYEKSVVVVIQATS